MGEAGAISEREGKVSRELALPSLSYGTFFGAITGYWDIVCLPNL